MASSRPPTAFVVARIFQVMFAATTMVFVWHGETPWSQESQSELQAQDIVAASGPRAELRGTGSHHSKPLALDIPAGEDSHTESKSWTETFAECVAGFLCFWMSVGILWLNEGHAVRMDQLVTLARRRLRASPAAPASDENLRELIFATGISETKDTISLGAWAGLKAPPGSAKLRAKVMMYQWVEKKESKDNETKYTYSKTWVDEQVNSGSFRHSEGHQNPNAPQPFLSLELASTNVGDFTMSKRMLGRLQQWKACDVSGELDAFQSISALSGYQRGSCTTHDDKQAVFFGLQGSGGQSAPEVGDLLVFFEYVSCGETTLLGVQIPCQPPNPGPWTLVPLQFTEHHSYMPTLKRASTATTNLGDAKHETLLGESETDEYIEEDLDPLNRLKRGVEHFIDGFPNPFAMAEKFMEAVSPDGLLVVVEEKVSAEEAVSRQIRFEAKLTSVVRLFGFVLMYVSLEAFFSPLKRLFSYLWIVGSILNAGIGLVSCACACSCSCCTIASAYVAYRPLYAGCLFLMAGSMTYFTYMKSEAPAQHF
eukprot:TRINITY_DN39841_c0_g1_i1.p1 TRINITY_DN39841_c0_g1~~TRINITY_DN39841_c0_g1_i1.p1  ORF type:complete len:539 (-),score=95.32 TRINITY_DN39841_c0_g1_i1:65-1681(-)